MLLVEGLNKQIWDELSVQLPNYTRGLNLKGGFYHFYHQEISCSGKLPHIAAKSRSMSFCQDYYCWLKASCTCNNPQEQNGWQTACFLILTKCWNACLCCHRVRVKASIIMIDNRIRSAAKSKLHQGHQLQRNLGNTVISILVSVVHKDNVDGNWKGCEIIHHIYHKIRNK